ncbi:hypothetical protein QBC34DRAFT_379396 [Podospora aff. communis PSN243]|uniref:Uncharacterized protein n=1 Tax=Podospora aff. communis PSN243 TaxID=3040156 RepID=A0AAV9GRB3_9PEZI|nr:hypothetical protein QBC34DRAFT_379396 [Podospora aff. communis PSN243]
MSPTLPLGAAELAADEAIAFPLVWTLPSPPWPASLGQRREIFVKRRALPKGGHVIAIVEKSSYTTGSTDTEWRYVNFDMDSIIPLYAAPELNRASWKFQVTHIEGALINEYPFTTSDGALGFQQLVTGYKTVAMFDEVTCLATYKGGLSLRRPQYAGIGAIQIWWDAEEPKAPSREPTLVSSGSSNSSQRSGRPTSIASIQTTSTLVQKYDGQPVLVVQKPRPPLLVAFLKNKGCGKAYATLKTDISSLTSTKITREKAILMFTVTGSTFQVNKFDKFIYPEPIAAWNICNLVNSKKRSDVLKCEYLSLDFGSAKDQANVARRDEFYNAVLRRQLAHLNRCSRLGKARDMEAAQQFKAMRASQLSGPSMDTIPRSDPVPPELPRYEPQPWISTDFITSPYGDPRFGVGAVTVELPGEGQSRDQARS